MNTSLEIAEYLKKVDPVMNDLIGDDFYIERETKDDYFTSLVSTIISQQISTKVAGVIYDRLVGLCNGSIDSTFLDSLNDGQLRAIGLSTFKIKYIRSLSECVDNGLVDLGSFDQMNDQDVIETLVKIKGIGVWSAQMFLIFSLKREDVFACLDGGLQRAFYNYYNNGERATDELMQKVSEKWQPYRSYASFYLWRSLR